MELHNVTERIGAEKLREWNKVLRQRGVKSICIKETGIARSAFYTIMKKKSATRKCVQRIDNFIQKFKELENA